MSASSRPSSADISLSAGINIAHISRVGACLDRLSIAGTELVQQFPQDTPRPFFAGVLLAPWPNRIRDGRWTQEMVENDLEYTFWPLHEVFGNEVNEYGKLRPRC